MDLAARLLDEDRVALFRLERAALDEDLTVKTLGLRDLEQRRVERRRVDGAHLVCERTEVRHRRRSTRIPDTSAPEGDRAAPTIGAMDLETARQAPIARV